MTLPPPAPRGPATGDRGTRPRAPVSDRPAEVLLAEVSLPCNRAPLFVGIDWASQTHAVCVLDDAGRVAGVNENLAILLLAAKFGIPVCPHAGGVGLCELVEHLAMFDDVAVSGDLTDRAIEYVDHLLQEHFVDPVVVRAGRSLAPRARGSARPCTPRTLAAYVLLGGEVWSGDAAERHGGGG